MMAGTTGKASGGCIAHTPAVAAASAAPVIALARRSRLVMRERRRLNVSARRFCSSSVGEMDIPRDIGRSATTPLSGSPHAGRSSGSRTSVEPRGDAAPDPSGDDQCPESADGHRPPGAGGRTGKWDRAPAGKQPRKVRNEATSVPLHRAGRRRPDSRCGTPRRPRPRRPASTDMAVTTSVDTSSCTDPALSQPFLAWGDSNWYALAPGEAADDFDGTGWALTGGAQIAHHDARGRRHRRGPRSPARLAGDRPDDLPDVRVPDGADDGPQRLRLERRQRRLLGVLRRDEHGGCAAPDRHVQDHRQPGRDRRLELSDPANLDPSSAPGWQLMQITLTANGPKEFQVYNLYNDPRNRD